jgi:hypothetical protein
LVLNYSKIYGGKIYGISPVLRFNHLEKYESQYVIFEVTEAIFEVTEAAGIPILRVPKIASPIFTLHAVAAVAATAAGGRCCGFFGFFETVVCRGLPAGTMV